MPEANGQRQRVIKLARQLIEDRALILDTETTGLGDEDEIVEIAVIDAAGTLEFSALVKPSKSIPAETTRVHGITDEIVASARPWREVWSVVHSLVGSYSLPAPVLAYNSDFDRRLIGQTCRISRLDDRLSSWYCLMNMWMEFHALRRWSRLENVCRQIGVEVGGHRALGDARAAREVLRWLAGQEASISEYQQLTGKFDPEGQDWAEGAL